MLLTEQEASTKRCPESFGPPPQQATVCNASLTTGSVFYGQPNGLGGAAGVYPYTMSPLNCIGSACMAWRTVPAISQNMRDAKAHLAAGAFIDAIRSWRAATGEGLKESKDAIEAIRDGRRDWPPAVEKGYCGKAGHP